MIGLKDIELRDKKLRELLVVLKQRMSFTKEIDDFYGKIEDLHQDFMFKLTDKHPDLSEKERKLATLLRMNLSSKEIATLMNITPKSAEIARYRLRKKLGLKDRENIHDFLLQL